MVGHMAHAADFERLLAQPSRWRSAHFALHHLDSEPQRPVRPGSGPGANKLSTATSPICPPLVDDSPSAIWLGYVVPKRHARRAVTRNLLRRQIRAAFQRHGAALPRGLWLVRLRAPFPASAFVSAASAALAAAARDELEQLLQRLR